MCFSVALALILATCLGCAASEGGTARCNGQRIIVSTPPDLDVRATKLQATINREIDRRAYFMREIMAGHFLFCLEGAGDDRDLANLAEILVRLPDIDSVEPDRRYKLQSETP